METQEISFLERLKTGTTKTKNNEFETNGYLIIKNLYDPQKLTCTLPEERGQLTYWGKNLNQFHHEPIEQQVEGSLARYWHPQYRQAHTDIRLRFQKEIGRLLYNTYYYDRFYFPGQELKPHVDRDACEISVTVHIGTNLPEEYRDWPIWIKTPDTYADEDKKIIKIPGENRKVILGPGDGMIYKGCERPHWRESMPNPLKGRKIKNKKGEFYYHQIFFHYVLQDGYRAHCAFDAAK